MTVPQATAVADALRHLQILDSGGGINWELVFIVAIVAIILIVLGKMFIGKGGSGAD